MIKKEIMNKPNETTADEILCGSPKKSSIMNSAILKQICNESKSKIKSMFSYFLIICVCAFICIPLTTLLASSSFSAALSLAIMLPLIVVFYVIYIIRNHYNVYAPLGANWKTSSTSSVVVNLFYSAMFGLLTTTCLVLSILWYGTLPMFLPPMGMLRFSLYDCLLYGLLVFVICMFLFSVVGFIIDHFVSKRYVLTTICVLFIGGFVAIAMTLPHFAKMTESLYDFLINSPFGIMCVLAIATVMIIPLNYLLGFLRGAKR